MSDESASIENVDDETYPSFSVMDVVNVVFTLPAPNPVVNLQEQAEPFRPLSFPIGLPEAQAIGSALAGITGARPTTHELFVSLQQELQGELVAIRITDYASGVFHAEMDFMTPRGRAILDCRPTDGIILALRQPVPAPILCDVNVLEFVASQS